MSQGLTLDLGLWTWDLGLGTLDLGLWTWALSRRVTRRKFSSASEISDYLRSEI